MRLPIGRRTFEGYDEDLYLTARMAVSYFEGVQSEGVAATVKHLAANNQEYWGFKGLVMSDWGAVHGSIPERQHSASRNQVWRGESQHNRRQSAEDAEGHARTWFI